MSTTYHCPWANQLVGVASPSSTAPTSSESPSRHSSATILKATATATAVLESPATVCVSCPRLPVPSTRIAVEGTSSSSSAPSNGVAEATTTTATISVPKSTTTVAPSKVAAAAKPTTIVVAVASEAIVVACPEEEHQQHHTHTQRE